MRFSLADRKIQIIVAAALLFIVAYNVRHFSKAKSTKHRGLIGENTAEPRDDATVKAKWGSGDYMAAPDWGRDPFDLGGASEEAQAPEGSTSPKPVPRKRYVLPVAISGIVITDDSRFILAGDALLTEGDFLGDGRIIEINRRSVVVEYERGTRTVVIE